MTKIVTDFHLLTGHTRSLLEAAKLSICPEDSYIKEDLEMENEPSIAALSDHDYTPPVKRGRSSIFQQDEDSYCFAPVAFDAANQPMKDKTKIGRNKGDASHDSWLDGGGILTPDSEPSSPDPPLDEIQTSIVSDVKDELDLPPVKLDYDLSDKLSQEAVDSMMRRLEGHQNWTEPGKMATIDSLAKSLIVELAASAGKIKLFREDTELE